MFSRPFFLGQKINKNFIKQETILNQIRCILCFTIVRIVLIFKHYA